MTVAFDPTGFQTEGSGIPPVGYVDAFQINAFLPSAFQALISGAFDVTGFANDAFQDVISGAFDVAGFENDAFQILGFAGAFQDDSGIFPTFPELTDLRRIWVLQNVVRVWAGYGR